MTVHGWIYGIGDGLLRDLGTTISSTAEFSALPGLDNLIDAPVEIKGRSLGRVAIRRDMRTGDLLRQVTWSRAARHDDEHARAYAQVLLDDLAEQVGLT